MYSNAHRTTRIRHAASGSGLMMHSSICADQKRSKARRCAPEAPAEPQLDDGSVQLCELSLARDPDIQVEKLEQLLAGVKEGSCVLGRGERWVLSPLSGSCGNTD